MRDRVLDSVPFFCSFVVLCLRVYYLRFDRRMKRERDGERWKQKKKKEKHIGCQQTNRKCASCAVHKSEPSRGTAHTPQQSNIDHKEEAISVVGCYFFKWIERRRRTSSIIYYTPMAFRNRCMHTAHHTAHTQRLEKKNTENQMGNQRQEEL